MLTPSKLLLLLLMGRCLSLPGLALSHAWKVLGPAAAAGTFSSPGSVRAARLSLRGFRKAFTTALRVFSSEAALAFRAWKADAKYTQFPQWTYRKKSKRRSRDRWCCGSKA